MNFLSIRVNGYLEEQWMSLLPMVGIFGKLKVTILIPESHSNYFRSKDLFPEQMFYLRYSPLKWAAINSAHSYFPEKVSRILTSVFSWLHYSSLEFCRFMRLYIGNWASYLLSLSYFLNWLLSTTLTKLNSKYQAHWSSAMLFILRRFRKYRVRKTPG